LTEVATRGSRRTLTDAPAAKIISELLAALQQLKQRLG
jgi:hypothetical protein